MTDQEYLTVAEIAERIRRRVSEVDASVPTGGNHRVGPSSPVRLDELLRSLRRATTLLNTVGEITPRPPGLINSLAQLAKKWIQASLMWVFRPLRQYNSALLMAITEATHVMEAMEYDLNALRGRMEIQDSATQAAGAERMTPERILNPRTTDVSEEIALIRLEIEKLHVELAKLLMDRASRDKSGQE